MISLKTKVITLIKNSMKPFLDKNQIFELDNSLKKILKNFELIKINKNLTINESQENQELLKSFLAAKEIEGCSERTLAYYNSTIIKMLDSLNLRIESITTEDLRNYLADYKNNSNSSKSTIDNIRRVLSSFFSWLEDEDYILKNPVRRIHKIKTKKVVKEIISDENFEIIRENCNNIRDLAMIELLASTGIRVGELVNLNIEDLLFNERECIVLG